MDVFISAAPHETLTIRFSVAAFIPTTTRVAITGSITELGGWKEAIELEPVTIAPDEYHGSVWWADVPISRAQLFGKIIPEFKFVLIPNKAPLKPFSPAPADLQTLPKSIETDIVTLDIVKAFWSLVPQSLTRGTHQLSRAEHWQWETGCNRELAFSAEKNHSLEYGTPFRFYYEPAINLLAIKENSAPYYVLPIMRFRAGGDAEDANPESAATSRYYLRKKEFREMHFDRVTTKLWVGTCPRKPGDFEFLKENGVTDIFNLQEAEDVAENFADEETFPLKSERHVGHLMDIARAADLNYLWLPVRDMCSSSRARSVAQAAFLIAGLLARRSCGAIYIHCNAGVGRSVAAAAAYLFYCKRVPLRICNLLLTSRRPCAFFDDEALLAGYQNFENQFAEATRILQNETGNI